MAHVQTPAPGHLLAVAVLAVTEALVAVVDRMAVVVIIAATCAKAGVKVAPVDAKVLAMDNVPGRVPPGVQEGVKMVAMIGVL